MSFHPYLDSQDYLIRLRRKTILEREKRIKKELEKDLNKQKENIGR
jgi:hypothetical protein